MSQFLFSPLTAVFACERKPCPTLQSLPAPLSFASSLWTNQNQKCWISKDLPGQSFPALVRAELLQHQPGLSKKQKKFFSIKKWCELWSSIHWVTTEHLAPNWAGLVYKQTFLSQLKMSKSWLGHPWPSCFLGFLQNLDISLAVLHSSFPEINNLVAKLQNHSCWILESFPFPLFSLCD